MTRGWPIAAIAGLVGLCSLAGCLKTRVVTFEPIRFEQWQHQLQSMKGRIVVVEVWATWCAPCVERFPHMVELYSRYKDQGVEFVSISVDDREDKAAVQTARQFVRRQNATFRNYLMDENILDSFEKLGVQGIPAVLLYDRAGRQRYNLNGDDPNHQATLKDVDDALATLVADRHGLSVGSGPHKGNRDAGRSPDRLGTGAAPDLGKRTLPAGSVTDERSSGFHDPQSPAG